MWFFSGYRCSASGFHYASLASYTMQEYRKWTGNRPSKYNCEKRGNIPKFYYFFLIYAKKLIKCVYVSNRNFKGVVLWAISSVLRDSLCNRWVNVEFGFSDFFLVPLFHFSCCTIHQWGCIKSLYCRQFQSFASFRICKIQPLFSKVRFSVFTYGFFRNLYYVNFVFGQLKLSSPQHGINFIVTFP